MFLWEASPLADRICPRSEVAERARLPQALEVTKNPARVKLRGHVQRRHAKVAELADALDLGSSGETRESSSLSFRTTSAI